MKPYQWQEAVHDGWIDLWTLRVPLLSRPECGASNCKDGIAAAVDPCGVGWCRRHVDLSLCLRPRTGPLRGAP